MRQLLGSAGKDISVKPGFQCDMGVNISVGDGFLTNYNVTILEIGRAHV